MQEILSERQAAITRISQIVDELIQGNTLYQEKLNKNEVMKSFAKLVDKFSPQFVINLDDKELTERIDRVMIVDAIAGTLNDLTPEQIKMYDEAVEGK
jgi:hypothetical protein